MCTDFGKGLLEHVQRYGSLSTPSTKQSLKGNPKFVGCFVPTSLVGEADLDPKYWIIMRKGG